ncbi:MAG: hypothetical protein ACM36B_14405, partial [Bacteroidota bacterium]
MEKFQPFSPLHAAALAAIGVATYGAVRAARRGASPKVERAVGIAFVATWLAVHGWWLLPARFDATTTLPLQMCHWTAL